jgi:hypothetical protein
LFRWCAGALAVLCAIALLGTFAIEGRKPWTFEISGTVFMALMIYVAVKGCGPKSWR